MQNLLMTCVMSTSVQKTKINTQKLLILFCIHTPTCRTPGIVTMTTEVSTPTSTDGDRVRPKEVHFASPVAGVRVRRGHIFHTHTHALDNNKYVYKIIILVCASRRL